MAVERKLREVQAVLRLHRDLIRDISDRVLAVEAVVGRLFPFSSSSSSVYEQALRWLEVTKEVPEWVKPLVRPLPTWQFRTLRGYKTAITYFLKSPISKQLLNKTWLNGVVGTLVVTECTFGWDYYTHSRTREVRARPALRLRMTEEEPVKKFANALGVGTTPYTIDEKIGYQAGTYGIRTIVAHRVLLPTLVGKAREKAEFQIKYGYVIPDRVNVIPLLEEWHRRFPTFHTKTKLVTLKREELEEMEFRTASSPQQQEAEEVHMDSPPATPQEEMVWMYEAYPYFPPPKVPPEIFKKPEEVKEKI